MKKNLIINFPTLISTQLQIKEMIASQIYKEHSFIHTSNQINGYGRGRTNWYSSKGTLTFSYAIKHNQKYLAILTNIKETLSDLGVKIEIKWPNDILINKFKIGGVLIEKYMNYNIIGIGINLYNTNYPSIKELTGILLNKFAFLTKYRKYYLNDKIDFFMEEFIFHNNKICKILNVDDDL
ncbi:biotin-[acetyl-CoA-carboxylase] ligase, partial [Anncaliia algerae PRA109]